MKRFIMMSGIFIIITVAFGKSGLGNIIYITRYKVTVVDTAQSADGVYEIILQKVGEPHFPFGDAPGRLVLKQDEMIISKADFGIANDGASFSERAWSVTWYDEYVEIILSGSEQSDEQVDLYYDGRVERNQHWGIDIGNVDSDAAADATDTADDLEDESFPDEQLINNGYMAIYHLFSDSGIDDFQVHYGAKAFSSRCILWEDENTIEYLVYSGRSENEKCGLYVRYQSEKNADDTWSNAEGIIMDIYAYVYESSDVVSSGKTHWGDVGAEAYRKATNDSY